MSGEIVEVVERDMAKPVLESIEKVGEAVPKHFGEIGEKLEQTVTSHVENEAGIVSKIEGIGGGEAQGALSGAEADASAAGRGTAAGAEGDLRGGGGGEDGATGNGDRETGNTDPVDLVSGRMITSKNDLALPGSLPLVLRRAYGSGYAAGRLLGPGWASTLDQRVQLDADGIHYAGADGEILHYPVPTRPGQEVLPAHGARWPLTWDRAADELRVRDPWSGWIRHFTTLGMTHSGDALVRPLTAVSDRNGRRITFVRDDEGVPTEVQHSGGYRIAVDTVYTAAGFRIEALRLLDGTDGGRGVQVVGYQYDPAGRLVGVVNSSGLPYVYEYDEADRITAWTDRNGFRYEYAYDDAGRVARGTGKDGYLSVSFDYDAEARTTTVTDALGHATTYHYDQHSHITKVVDPLGGAVTTEYDRHGRLVSRADELGHATRYSLDERGAPLRVEYPDGSALATTYDASGGPTRIQRPDGTEWQYEYDERGNLLRATDPLGASSSFGYDERGHLTSSTDGLGHSRSASTDAAGLTAAAVDASGGTTALERDAFGRIVRVTEPSGAVTTAGWTVEGLLAWRVRPDGSREDWEYDPEGNLLRHTGPAGTRSFEWDGFHLVRSRTDADGTRLRFAYDGRLKLVSVTGASGAVWRYEYDAAGRLIGETDFDGRTLTYRYDAAGRLAERMDGAGVSTVLTRDQVGRVTELSTGDGGSIGYEFDAIGRLVRASSVAPGSASSLLEYERDELGRVVAETVDGHTLRNEYDRLGRRVRRTTPAGVVSEWTYSPDHRPLTLSTDGGALSFEYDASGRESTRFLGSGAALTSSWREDGRLAGQAVWSYRTAQSGADDAIADPSNGYELLQQRDFGYLPDGRVGEITDHLRGTRRFEYDHGRVTNVYGATAQGATWTETYAYDETGNLALGHRSGADASQDPAIVAPNEYTGTRLRSSRDATFEYDAQGRTVRRIQRTLSGQRREWRFEWETGDRLAAVTTPDGSRWTYAYDSIGRRIFKQHSVRQRADEAETVLESTRFVWDGPQIAESVTTDAAGRSTTRTWNYDPGTHRPATQTETRRGGGGGDAEPTDAEVDLRFYAIVADLVGAPSELITGDGRVAWRGETDLWGAAPAAGADAETDCPLRFPGQYLDAETGWHYNHHRYYDPETARYTSPDPLGLPAGPNPYAYVVDPLLWADPLGLTAERITPEHRILNIGAGDNPMPGAVNIDIDPRADGVIRADATDLPFADGSFDEVHAINPFGYQPVNPEVARVMAPGGTLQVSGNVARNKWMRPTPEQVQESGLQLESQGPLTDAHQFGEQKTTTGHTIDTSRLETKTYRKPTPCPE